MTGRREPGGVRDVVVVGGGPAGASTAAFLARLGRDVLVSEAARFPREKICGEFLPPSAGPLLDRIGALADVEALSPRRPVGMAVVAPGGARVLGRFGEEAGPGYALRRPDLDAAILAAARRAGAEVLEGARVADLAPRPGGGYDLTVTRGGYDVTMMRGGGETLKVSARAIVGADGRNSFVARRLGLRRGAPRHRRWAVMGRFTGALTPEDHGEMIVTSDGYCGINPLPGGEANVCFVIDPRRAATPFAPRVGSSAPHRASSARPGPPSSPGFLPGRAHLERYVRWRIDSDPALGARLGEARLQGRLAATGPVACGSRRTAAEAALLVGDAAEFFDPFTGEGVGMALRAAEIAAETLDEALRRGDLSRRSLAGYERRRRRAFAGRFRVDRALQRILDHARLTDFVAARLERQPALADRLARVTAGLAPAGSLVRPDRVLRFLWA